MWVIRSLTSVIYHQQLNFQWAADEFGWFKLCMSKDSSRDDSWIDLALLIMFQSPYNPYASLWSHKPFNMLIFQPPYNPYDYGGIPIPGTPGRPTGTAARGCGHCESHRDCTFCGVASYCRMNIKKCSFSPVFPGKPTDVAWSGHGRYISPSRFICAFWASYTGLTVILDSVTDKLLALIVSLWMTYSMDVKHSNSLNKSFPFSLLGQHQQSIMQYSFVGFTTIVILSYEKNRASWS